MAKWKACPQFNGPEVSLFQEVEFEVSDELYEKIMQAVADNIPLIDCDFYSILSSSAADAFEFDEDEEDDDDLWEKPQREDFDSDEEYEYALEEYEDQMEYADVGYSFVAANVYDPGEFRRFNEAVTGKKLKEFSEGMCGTAEIEIDRYDDGAITYTIYLNHDENGVITGAEEADGLGMVSDGVKGGDSAECYPDYQYILQELRREYFEE